MQIQANRASFPESLSIWQKEIPARGTRLRPVAEHASAAGVGVLQRDGRDEDARVVEDGAYLVAIGAFGETQTRALAVVR